MCTHSRIHGSVPKHIDKRCRFGEFDVKRCHSRLEAVRICGSRLARVRTDQNDRLATFFAGNFNAYAPVARDADKASLYTVDTVASVILRFTGTRRLLPSTMERSIGRDRHRRGLNESEF